MTIQEIKSSLPITQVLNHYNLKANQNQMLCCPFHSDQKASMKIYPQTNTAYCFAGSCKVESLDSIDFIMQMDEISKHEAILKAKSFLVNSPIKSTNQKRSTMNAQMPDPKLLTELFTYFRNSLNHSRSKSAKAYKESRGLNGKLAIGYNSGKFHNGKSKVILDRLQMTGLLKPSENGYQPWANGCLIFALKNRVGEISGLYGRSTSSEGHFYLKNRKGLYPGYPNVKTKKLVLTESIIDTASLLQLELGLENYAVLSLFGTNGLTTEHRQAILECIHLKEIIFAMDGDEAGRKATQTYTKQLKELYPDLKFTTLVLPEGEDINSVYVNHEDEVELLFNQLFENRREVGSSKNEVQLKEESTKNVSRLITENVELLVFGNGVIQIQVLGGIRLEGLDRMRVTLKLVYQQKTLRHNLDLYNDDQVDRLVKKVCNRMELGSREVQSLLDDLTESLESYRMEQVESSQKKPLAVKRMTSNEESKAKEYLSGENLMQRTMDDLGKSGIIGESKNRLLMLMVMTSRKRDHPLHVISLAASGQGKTHLQECVSACIPDEDKMEITSLSDNALYYFGKEELKHKLLLIEDLDGAEGVLYPLRELQSKRRITKTVTLKDQKGRLKTKSLEVEGPVSVAGCTTRERMYEDNANRSFLLYLDNSAEQDQKIMDYQRSLSAGKINRQLEKQMREQFQNMQRLLRNIQVRNPYAELLQIPSSVFKPRRSNAHYLAFIEAVTFYHQYQRKVKTNQASGERYIETSLEDIEWANKLLAPVLLRKSDELSGACRSFLERLKSYLKKHEKQSFYSKEIKSELRINYNSLKRYLRNLNQEGYIKVVGGTKSKGFEYEVVSFEEYQELQSQITSVLDEVLNKAKSK